jgi:peptidoglycan-N-acetylglucosamine deacetylase
VGRLDETGQELNLDWILGQAIRSIPSSKKTLYLTFDDGPSERGTDQVLKILDQHQVNATFFLVAEKAKQSQQLVKQIQSYAHGIGNHSLDHTYHHLFRGKKSLLSWVSKAENILSDQIGSPTAGFRPPAGVRTPELNWVLHSLKLPQVLWNVRFFDTVFQWTPKAALKSMDRIQNGSIILLHDHPRSGHFQLFLETLSDYIKYGKQKGFEFSVLDRQLCTEVHHHLLNRKESL